MSTQFRRSAVSIALLAVLATVSRVAVAPPTPGTSFFTVTPCRILDTRLSDGPLGGPVLAAGETRVFTATGVCTIPAAATGLAVNVTLTQPGAPGFLQAFPGDATPPATSLLNFAAGQTRANNAVVSLASDASGTFAVRNASAGTAHVIVDVSGYFVTTCAPITLAPATLPNGSTTTPYSQTVTATGGTGPYAFNVTAGTPPPGLNLAADGTLSGTPTQGGTFDFTATATDAKGCTGSRAYSLVVDCPTITVSGSIPTLTYNTAWAGATFTQSGTSSTVTWSATGLPAGVTIDSSTGVVTGTPTATGTFSVTITATDAGGCTGIKIMTLPVAPTVVNQSYAGVGNTQLWVSGIASPPSRGVIVSTALLSGAQPAGGVTLSNASCVSGGTITSFDGAGRFIFTPDVGSTSASCSFQVTSNTGGTGAPAAANGTFSISMLNRVWWVDNSSGAATHDGRSNTPFVSMTELGAASTSNNDFINVRYGTGGAVPGAYAMKPGQNLIGSGADLNVPMTTGTFTIVSTGSFPNLTGTLTLANNVVVDGINLSTSGARAITNFNGSSYSTVTGVNVKGRWITTTTGTAIDIQGTGNTGSMSFEAVSANGGANGIVLVNFTGGTFTVTGAGSAGSGGTIQNTTGVDGGIAGSGVYLSNAAGVSLSWMNLHDFQNYAIRGLNVAGFTLASSTISGVNGTNASGDGEGGVYFDGLTGAGGISNTSISGALVDNVHVASSSGTLTSFAVTGCTIADNSAASGNVGIQFLAKTTANMTVSVQNSTFHGNRTVAVRGDAADGSTLSATFTGNTIVAGSPNQGNQGIEISKAATSNVTFVCDGNKVGTPDGTTIQALGNTGINVFSGSTAGSMTGTVKNNVVINAGAGVSGFGIRVFNSNLGTMNVNVANNAVSNVGLDYGILCESSGAASPGGLLAVALTGNTSDVLAGALDAMRVQARNFNQVCARVSGNISTSAGSGFVGLTVRQANSAVFNLEGLAAGSQTAAATQTYVASQNPGVTDGVLGLAATNFTGVSSNSCGITP